MPSSVGVDGGESLQAAGDVRGKRRLADVLQALKLTNQNPAGKNGRFYPTVLCVGLKLDGFLYILYRFLFFFTAIWKHHVAVKINKFNLGKSWNASTLVRLVRIITLITWWVVCANKLQHVC